MAPDSVIHDIGYQRYTGPRLGRGFIARSLYRHGLRTAFGLGRSAKSKIFPWAMVGVLVFLAVIDIAIRVQTGKMPISYLGFCDDPALVVLLWLAAAAPELVSRDLRNGLLPLYFSRPLSRADYAWAKLAALASAQWLLYAGPLTLILVAGEFSVDSWHARVHEFTDFLGALALAAIYALVLGPLALLIASWLRRRMVAAAAIVGFFLLTYAIGAAVEPIIGGDNGKAVGRLIRPPNLVIGLKEWIFQVHGTVASNRGPLFLAVTLLLVAGTVTLFQLRYRRVSG